MRRVLRSQRRFHAKRIKNGKLFVVLRDGGDHLFAPSKFSGYKNNNTSHADDLENRDGRITNAQIIRLFGEPLDQGKRNYKKTDTAFLAYCKQHGIVPSKFHRPRRYWMVGFPSTTPTGTTFSLPDEVPDSELYEGASQQVSVNRSERNPEARAKCIEHYGWSCSVCDFDFSLKYGDHGRNYIHVHHLVPMSAIGKQYKINPQKDLRPVCANCHAMLHRGDRVLQIRALRNIIRAAQRRTNTRR